MFLETNSDSSNVATLDPPRSHTTVPPIAPVTPVTDQPVNDPPSPRPRKRSVVRTLFVSDLHLGCRHSQAAAFLEMLQRVEPEQIYLVGDFIDGWKLKNRWRWLPEYDLVIQRLLELKRSGTRLCYTPGNHDEFLRGFLANFGVVEIQDRFVHTAADGRRYVVTHGDQFDKVEQGKPWVSLLASYAYDVLLSANWLGNRLRGKKHNPYAFCAKVKGSIKQLVKHVSDFETQLVDSAHADDADGIICGHIHVPRIAKLGDINYMNTGDWVENCSALLERLDGSFELVRQDGKLIAELPAQPARPPSEAARLATTAAN